MRGEEDEDSEQGRTTDERRVGQQMRGEKENSEERRRTDERREGEQ